MLQAKVLIVYYYSHTVLHLTYPSNDQCDLQEGWHTYEQSIQRLAGHEIGPLSEVRVPWDPGRHEAGLTYLR